MFSHMHFDHHNHKINNIPKESSQGLRSALEAKAKQEAASGGRKGKRSMKPGRSKSLADLPQLSA